MKVLFESWRKFIKEDAAARKSFADELGSDNPDWESRRPNIDRGDTEAYKQNMKSGRVLKKLFHKYADQSFLNSLVLIHWARYQDIREIVQFGKIDKMSRDELSAIPYLPGTATAEGQGGRTGIIIKGRVTLLANSQDELYSGWGREYRKAAPERAKMSGANKGVGRTLRAKEYEEKIFVLDKEDWKPRSVNDPEALVDNWKITHIIAENDERKDLLEKYVEKSGLDVPVILYDEVSKL